MRRRWRLVAVAALVVLAFELRHPRVLSAWCGVHVWPRVTAAWLWMRNDLPRLIRYTLSGDAMCQLLKNANTNYCDKYCVYTEKARQVCIEYSLFSSQATPHIK